MFVAAACNDGSLPVLAVQNCTADSSSSMSGNGNTTNERQAVMAIEPVDGPVAGEERFRCIQRVSGYYVVTANSAGVVSLMNLNGAVKMIIADETAAKAEALKNNATSFVEETPVDPESDDSDDDSDDEEEELAVDIIDSVRLGSGARITSLATWCCHTPEDEDESADDDDDDDDDDDNQQHDDDDDDEEISRTKLSVVTSSLNDSMEKNKRKYMESSRDDDKYNNNKRQVMFADRMDPVTLSKARELVSKAKKIQSKKSKKREKSNTKTKN
jgi:hypothetical protein